ncbi:MAG: 4Fe-4S binding protein [Methanobrevibacter sp.]|jgi:ferredoxin|nr:4Fe-4S binding protein [Methanobrevibacter sp.]
MQIDQSNCAKCGICVDACPNGLIIRQGFKIIIKGGCTNCKKCLGVCPMDVIFE